MTINDRVAYFINTLSVAEIVKKTDLGQSALYKIANGGGVSAATIEKICQAYPELNAQWLILGIGKMWKTSTEVENSTLMELNEMESVYEKKMPTEGVFERLERRVTRLEVSLEQLLNNQKK